MVEVAGLCASAPALEVIRPAGMAPFLRAQAKFFICSVRTLLFSTCAKAVATRWYVALMSLSTGSPVLVLSWYLLFQMSSEVSCIGIVVTTASALAFIATPKSSSMSVVEGTDCWRCPCRAPQHLGWRSCFLCCFQFFAEKTLYVVLAII